MSMNSVLIDSLTRIRNAQRVRFKQVQLIHSNFVVGVLKVLNAEGFVGEFSLVKGDRGMTSILLDLNYYNGKPVIEKIEVFSKPGCRYYVGYQDIKRYYNGLGVLVLTTSKGIITDHIARSSKVGGELLFGIF
ncbi:MAG: 30S ribosomal protein S8 [Candidatus Xenolissoclinum pacificiensis L6]|uniref:Small ribosomal subunit protein uS8 n=1 Tax=Candidatus Xenolissoclinum pacificiensis L6 TaxID=1401685 RepID=W2UYW8_9RICK|nr:MAG: 30S ribosomal protein S8 [Candidatus Xenolissoclinum pacificiensis L6]